MIRRGISRILVPIDGSKNAARALEEAIVIARGCGATITGLYCVGSQQRSEFGGGQEARVPPEARRFMGQARTLAAQNGIDFREKIARGDVGYGIVKAAGSPAHDMIVMGSRGRSSAKQMFFGSASNYVVHTARVPVLIVK